MNSYVKSKCVIIYRFLETDFFNLFTTKVTIGETEKPKVAIFNYLKFITVKLLITIPRHHWSHDFDIKEFVNNLILSQNVTSLYENFRKYILHLTDKAHIEWYLSTTIRPDRISSNEEFYEYINSYTTEFSPEIRLNEMESYVSSNIKTDIYFVYFFYQYLSIYIPCYKLYLVLLSYNIEDYEQSYQNYSTLKSSSLV